MYKTQVKLTSSKGSLAGGKLFSEKQIKEVLSAREMEQQIEKGHIEVLDIPVTQNSVVALSIEDLVEIENKSSLNVPQLKEIIEHYKLNIEGKKADLVAGIAEFEEILSKEFDELEDDELKAIARYYEVDETLEREAMIEAIEAKEE